MEAPQRVVIGSRIGFTSILTTGMVAGTITAVSFAVLSRFLIDDLGITRAQVGGLVTALAVIAAVTSPLAGGWTDRVGGRRALAWLFVLSAAGLLTVAAAPIYLLIVVAAGLAGLAQALANPATNKLIAQFVPVGGRGLITGIKQSGVQLGLVLAGLLLPGVAAALGWRVAFALVAVLPIAALVGSRFVVPPEEQAASGTTTSIVSLPQAVWWLTGYSFLMGLGVGALLTFLPLYAQEELGMTVTTAGLVVSVFGVIAMVMRIVSGPIAERLSHFGILLTGFSATAAVGVALLLLAPSAGLVALWAGVVLAGASATTWNAVAMLAVMDEAGTARAGSSSGFVVFGFLAGFGISPAAFGYSVDVLDSYSPGLMAIIFVFGIAAIVAGAWLAQSRAPRLYS